MDVWVVWSHRNRTAFISDGQYESWLLHGPLNWKSTSMLKMKLVGVIDRDDLKHYKVFCKLLRRAKKRIWCSLTHLPKTQRDQWHWFTSKNTRSDASLCLRRMSHTCAVQQVTHIVTPAGYQVLWSTHHMLHLFRITMVELSENCLTWQGRKINRLISMCCQFNVFMLWPGILRVSIVFYALSIDGTQNGFWLKWKSLH